MEPLPALCLLRLVREIDAALSGGILDKVLQPARDELSFRFRRKEDGGWVKRWLHVKVGLHLFIGDEAAGEGAGAFAQYLRSALPGARLISVSVHGFERVLLMLFATAEGERTLVLEQFGKGNGVLLDGETILYPLSVQKWRGREVRAGQRYIFPPARVNPAALDHPEFERLLRTSRGDLVRSLAVSLNLGGPAAEEVCRATGLERSADPKALPHADVDRLREAVAALLATVSAGNGGVVVEGPGPLLLPHLYETMRGRTVREFPTMNGAVRFMAERAPAVEADTESSREREAMKNREDALRAQYAAALEEEARWKAAGDAVFANYQYLEDLLGRVRAALGAAGSWQALLRAWKKGTAAVPEGVTLSQAAGEFAAQLPDSTEVPVRLAVTLRECAGECYERAKVARARADGVERAVAEMRAKSLELEHGHAQTKTADKKSPRDREAWYERYRWFVSGDGILVVGGKDAGTNERLVKRHLGPGDRFAHAEVHGAPSVVVRAEGREVPEATLRQACQFAICFSKAWAAGWGSGDAYWVMPDQVSKTPETGEFVPRGGFIVRGKRNRYMGLPLRLGVGFVELTGRRVVMCGPPEAFRSPDGVVVIAPGDLERNAASRAIAALLGCGADDVARVLPPGKCGVEGRSGN